MVAPTAVTGAPRARLVADLDGVRADARLGAVADEEVGAPQRPGLVEAAVQEDRGLDETGTLRRADLLVSDGPARVGAHTVEVGDQARAGAPVTALSATVVEVTAEVAAGNAGAVRRATR